MAILEFYRSQRLCEKRSVVILMYPPHLERLRQTRSENHDVHGSVETSTPFYLANDYAVRYGFAKRPHEKLSPPLRHHPLMAVLMPSQKQSGRHSVRCLETA